jgi:hypothetical protein
LLLQEIWVVVDALLREQSSSHLNDEFQEQKFRFDDGVRPKAINARLEFRMELVPSTPHE